MNKVKTLLLFNTAFLKFVENSFDFEEPSFKNVEHIIIFVD